MTAIVSILTDSLAAFLFLMILVCAAIVICYGISVAIALLATFRDIIKEYLKKFKR
jgi:hypothetical protein